MKYFLLFFCALLRIVYAGEQEDWSPNYLPPSSSLYHPILSLPLAHVNLAACNLTDKECIPLLTRLSQHSNLERLDLSINELGKEAAHHLTLLTDSALNLRYLDLHLNHFSDTFLIPILKNLQHHNKITYLDLSFNFIDSLSIDVICELARTASSLQQLSLDFIGLSKSKRLGLLQSLGQSSSIRHISLAYNSLVGIGKEIGQMIQACKTLTTLGLAWCDLTLADFTHLIQVVNVPFPLSRTSIFLKTAPQKPRQVTLKLERTYATELIAAYYAQHKLETPQVILSFQLGHS